MFKIFPGLLINSVVFMLHRFDLGIGAVMISSSTVVSDGMWHNVTVTRLGETRSSINGIISSQE